MFVIRRVVGRSMAPTLKPGRVVIGLRTRRVLQPGQIVIINHDGLEKIKRIARIEQDKLYVVGDNLDKSTDSRDFGFIPCTAVIATVIWPRSISKERTQ